MTFTDELFVGRDCTKICFLVNWISFSKVPILELIGSNLIKVDNHILVDLPQELDQVKWLFKPNTLF